MMRSYALLLILVIGLILPPPSQAADRQTLYQLRTYQLHPQSKAVFHARFRDHAVAIMKRHGFDIAAIWEADHNAARVRLFAALVRLDGVHARNGSRSSATP
jgi:hypothetical protein